ncbi:hypothetical protein HNR50_003357 [Spirochaeta isovalerica]|uniref:Uncharacterized protein n=1 Tax=Spirochaeta isovalerica TaxID=150 RepID=A0A841REP8_9SPIO|nr:hypothetical protein [Spirochaeta isovalerica]
MNSEKPGADPEDREFSNIVGTWTINPAGKVKPLIY